MPFSAATRFQRRSRPMVWCWRRPQWNLHDAYPAMSGARLNAAGEEGSMTPEERNLVNDLFDRLAALENTEREPEAERAIQEGLKRAPHAVYALVQTALVQDEALKRADARIHDLEAQLGSQAQPAHAGGFLGGMREALTGRRGSVPTVRPGD